MAKSTPEGDEHRIRKLRAQELHGRFIELLSDLRGGLCNETNAEHYARAFKGVGAGFKNIEGFGMAADAFHRAAGLYRAQASFLENKESPEHHEAAKLWLESAAAEKLSAHMHMTRAKYSLKLRETVSEDMKAKGMILDNEIRELLDRALKAYDRSHEILHTNLGDRLRPSTLKTKANSLVGRGSEKLREKMLADAKKIEKMQEEIVRHRADVKEAIRNASAIHKHLK